MAFTAYRFIIGRSIIENQGVSTDDATRLAVLPGLLETPLVSSVLVSTVVGRANAPVAAPEEVTPPAPATTVPNVVGLTVTDAETALQTALGVSPEEISEVLVDNVMVTNITLTENAVVGQSPVAGAEFAPGSTITLFVGAPPPPPPETATLSDFVLSGSTVAAAKSAVEGLGLGLTVEEIGVPGVSVDNATELMVVGQCPVAGTDVVRDSKVTLYTGGPSGLGVAAGPSAITSRPRRAAPPAEPGN